MTGNITDMYVCIYVYNYIGFVKLKFVVTRNCKSLKHNVQSQSTSVKGKKSIKTNKGEKQLNVIHS